MAPESASREDVHKAVKKRSRWIYEKLRDFRNQVKYQTPRKFVSGESHTYLGKQYQLKVTQSELKSNCSVKLFRGSLVVSLPVRHPQFVKEALDEWYKERAKEIFSKRLLLLVEQALWVNDIPSLKVRSMKTQWGSCSPSGTLTLNPNLVKAPMDCIDYVILHELCHIAEHNHSDRFYRLMHQVMPTWESVKQRLDANAWRFLG